MLPVAQAPSIDCILFNASLGERRKSRCWGTREAIEGLKGSAEIIEYSAAVVDASAVDSISFTALDFDPGTA
jgi:hypothetical protein